MIRSLYSGIKRLCCAPGKRKQRKMLPKSRTNYERDVGDVAFSSSQQIALHDAGVVEVDSPIPKRPKTAPAAVANTAVLMSHIGGLAGLAHRSADQASTAPSLRGGCAQHPAPTPSPPMQPAACAPSPPAGILQPLTSNPLAVASRRVLSLTSGTPIHCFVCTRSTPVNVYQWTTRCGSGQTRRSSGSGVCGSVRMDWTKG